MDVAHKHTGETTKRQWHRIPNPKNEGHVCTVEPLGNHRIQEEERTVHT